MISRRGVLKALAFLPFAGALLPSATRFVRVECLAETIKGRYYKGEHFEQVATLTLFASDGEVYWTACIGDLEKFQDCLRDYIPNANWDIVCQFNKDRTKMKFATGEKTVSLSDPFFIY
jgi:hypothetical protein